MKPVLAALLGSPLPEGNTAILLDKAMAGARDAGCDLRKIDVPELGFTPCREFYFCKDHDQCMMDDDMNEMYALFKEIDGLIIATPVMTMGVPGALKAFMDRFQVFFCAKYIRKNRLVSAEKRRHRRTLLISISGLNLPHTFDGVRLSAESFCDIIDCKLSDELYVRDMDNKKDLLLYPELLQEAYQKGKALGTAAVTALGSDQEM
ncbi:flavodoxin family protein [uncultured Methanospirillum sp.]|uniref:flavodoxin family protein n=1 Tax=uncultured Methanospirillum sp. TaxID=262503 RepID=UPI0029C7B74C|nr:flavodoxin family protein [uncultured Methanospirillum sp.]